MNTSNIIPVLLLTVIIIGITACSDVLDPTVNSELSTNALSTQNGIEAVLLSSYSSAQFQGLESQVGYQYSGLLPSGIAWQRKGGVSSDLVPLVEYSWTSANRFVGALWTGLYAAIRDANVVLANIDQDSFNTEFQTQITAEAKFLRGWSYYILYLKFGPTPIQKTPEDDPLLPRSSEEEMLSFIELELTDAAAGLPETSGEIGRATKGAALGLLMKFYLNTKQWQKSADITQQIMEMNMYSLQQNYADVFDLENEGNSELIWVINFSGSNGNNLNALTLPNTYPIPYSNIRAYGAETLLVDSFVNMFSENDSRINMIDTEYTLTNGNHIVGLGSDQSLSIKYPLDPNGDGGAMGNDMPIVRYADVLLSRAEALNEINGPTQESIDLINEVRTRAGISEINLGDYTQDLLRDFILEERTREFFYEFHEREDQIRHGVLISRAQDRGWNADDHHRLFAIPQTEMDANPNIEQNPRY